MLGLSLLLHNGPELVQQNRQPDMVLNLFTSHSQRAQFFADCCLVSADSCFIYFAEFLSFSLQELGTVSFYSAMEVEVLVE